MNNIEHISFYIDFPFELQMTPNYIEKIINTVYYDTVTRKITRIIESNVYYSEEVAQKDYESSKNSPLTKYIKINGNIVSEEKNMEEMYFVGEDIQDVLNDFGGRLIDFTPNID